MASKKSERDFPELLKTPSDLHEKSGQGGRFQ
jgi:hypothetical protein